MYLVIYYNVLIKKSPNFDFKKKNILIRRYNILQQFKGVEEMSISCKNLMQKLRFCSIKIEDFDNIFSQQKN